MTDTTVRPHHELGKELSNWGRWGDDDQIGTLNFITPEKLVASAKMVRAGKTIDCGIPFDKDGPFPPGGWRRNPHHLFTLLPSDSSYAKDGQIAADDIIIMGLQASTQWDGLAHVGYDGYFYNGMPAKALNNFQGASRNDIAQVATKLVSRGVLLDIAGLKGTDVLPDSYEITTADVEAAQERQGVRVESGDIACTAPAGPSTSARATGRSTWARRPAPALTSAAGSTTARSPRLPWTSPTARSGPPRCPAPPSRCTR